jgi:hypothetical protein
MTGRASHLGATEHDAIVATMEVLAPTRLRRHAATARRNDLLGLAVTRRTHHAASTAGPRPRPSEEPSGRPLGGEAGEEAERVVDPERRT